MSPKAKWILGVGGVVAVAILAWIFTAQLGLSDMGGNDEAIAPSEEAQTSVVDPGVRRCASQATVDAIRDRIFDRARQGADDPEALSRLEEDSFARLDSPEVVSIEENTDGVSCSARFVIELPRGSEAAFSYSRRLSATIDYVVGAGPGSIERLSRADMLIDELSRADLRTRPADPIGDLIDEAMDGEKGEILGPGDGDLPPEPPPADNLPEDLLPPAMERR